MTARRLPLRLIGWSVAVLVLLLPMAGLLQGWLAADRWPVKTLEVQAPYQHVSASTIRAAVLPYVGQGFFATDLAQVQQAIEALPWVASAEARKRWPDTLLIRVVERVPFAHWNGDALVDRHGRLFRVPGAGHVVDLPTLSGPDSRLGEVVAFYAHVRKQLDAVGLQLVGVHLNDRGGWRLDLADGAHLQVGRQTPDVRLDRFVRVYRQLAATHWQPFVYADLRYTNGFAVRWPDAAKPAATSAATPGASST